MSTAELLAKSVTADEHEMNSAGSLIRFQSFGYSSLIPLNPDPGEWWSTDRDLQLKRAYRQDGLFASAVNIAATRVAAQGYELDGDVGLRTRKAREMLGRGWVSLVQKLARDYCIQDNGAFLEIVRATKAAGSKVLGFVYLDPARCYRTGDYERPVIYYDRVGRLHEMRAHQVAEFSDMPEDEFFGVGMCAASRAYRDIYLHLSAETYIREKITGGRPQALDIVTGISPDKIADGMRDTKAAAEVQGYTQYRGAAVIANSNPIPVAHTRIEFASLPDKFDREQFKEQTQTAYAAALGIDPNELNPKLIGNRSLGAGSQAATLDDKQNSKGVIAFRLALRDFMNDTERWHPLPGGTTFAWSERDLKDQAAKADIAKVRADTRKVQIEAGEIDAKQSLQMAVDAGDVPASFLEFDTTTEETIADEDKAEAGSADTGASSQNTQLPPGNTSEQPGAPQPAPAVAPVAPVLKEWADALTTIKRMPAGATVLARFEPPAEAPRDAKSEASYWRAVTKQFDEIGSAWAAAAEPPQVDGETKRSIGYTIKNRNSNLVRLELHAGNTARPEVAIRAVLFGRKGFGPKKAKVLRFRAGGKMVYARKVRGAAANDWFGRSMDAIKPQIRAAEKALGKFAASEIDAGDVAGARVYRTAPPAPSDAAIKRARRAARGKELADALEVGGVL
jgi:hypothetical protein